MSRRLSFWLIVACVGAAGLAAQQPGPPGPPPTGTGLILGRVVDAVTNAPIIGIAVQLGPAAGSALPNSVARSALTDKQGRFVFRDLPAGSYNLMSRLGGNGFSPSGFLVTGIGHPIAPYLPGGYGQRRPDGFLQPLELADNQHIPDAVIRLWKGGAIDGHVYDEAGEPVVDVVVSAVRRNSDGRLTTGPTASTDDRGAYHIGTLVPGEYLVVVPQTQVLMPSATIEGFPPEPNAGYALSSQITSTGAGVTSVAGLRVGRATLFTAPPISSAANVTAPPVSATSERFVYQSTFHPSSFTTRDARAITVVSGQTQEGIEIRLRPVRAADVSGVLADSSGPVPNFSVHLLPADTGDGASVLTTASTATDSQGAFTFPLVPPGQYTLWSFKAPTPPRAGGPPAAAAPPPPSRPAEAPGAWANQPVTVAQSSVDNVSVVLRAGVTVSGRVEYRGSGARPSADELRPLAVLIGRAEPIFRSAPAPQRGVIDASDHFSVAGNAPGRYVIRVADTPAWRLESVSIGGIDRTDEVVTIGDEGLAGVVIVLTDRAAQISGTVQSAGAAGGDQTATVFAFPADPRRWPSSTAQLKTFRTARTTRTGSFLIPAMVPGDYLVAAVPDEQTQGWPDRAFIQRLTAFATRHTLAPSDRQVITLRTGAVR
jgi:hypothetical protein